MAASRNDVVVGQTRRTPEVEYHRVSRPRARSGTDRDPIGSVDQARRALECVSATVAVGLNLVDRSEDDETTLIGLRRLFDALNVLIERERTIEPLCELPCFDPEPPDAA
jgi:hypothetical protein